MLFLSNLLLAAPQAKCSLTPKASEVRVQEGLEPFGLRWALVAEILIFSEPREKSGE
jgi:hypothetical protein